MMFCFAWSHDGGYAAPIIERRYHYLIDWIKSHLSARITRKCKGDAAGKFVSQDTGGLDHRFRSISPYQGLKTFTNFNNVKQWTGVEQKAAA